MTPNELNIRLQEHDTNEKEDIKLMITQAYYAAAFHRAKRLPKLENILSKMFKKDKKKMTDEEMFKMVEVLNAAFGGEDRRCK